MEFDVRTRDRDGWIVVEVSGEVDISTAPDLRGALEEAGTGGSVVVDLRGVTFMDSSGLEVLVAAAGELEEGGGRLVVVCGEGPVRRILGITGLDRELALRSSVDEAIG